MDFAAEGPRQAVDDQKYGRFTRRLQAVLIDSIVVLLMMAGALGIGVALESNNISRILGFTVVVGFLLYEPLLVWLAGSTVGHLLSNLRVVDDRSHRNVNFPKAVARVVIKSALGWYSFITMATTRRHQALHDLLTRSTVQIRNPAKARAHHYLSARQDPVQAGMPSAARRIMVIVVYQVAVFCAATIGMAVLELTGVWSDACALQYRCSPADRVVELIDAACWIGLGLWCVVLGWKGRLFGARVRPQSAS